jgi:hypothetical protein
LSQPWIFQKMIGYQQKNRSIDSLWWELSTDVLFNHSQSSVRICDRKKVIGNNWQNQQLHMVINNYLTDVQSNLIEPQMYDTTAQITI